MGRGIGGGNERGTVAGVISRSAADTFSQDGPPIGSLIRMPGSEKYTIEVAGIVENVGMSAPSLARPQIYAPLATSHTSARYLVANGPDRPSETLKILMAVVRSLDPSFTPGTAAPLSSYLDSQSYGTRAATVVLSALGLFGCLLVGIGVHALVSHSVSARTKELAVRVALGCTPISLLRLVVTEAVIAISAGSVGGLLVSFHLGQIITARLVGLERLDLVSGGLVWLFVSGVALVSCLGPVRRAWRTDPASILKGS
jgi:hypothetical protein